MDVGMERMEGWMEIRKKGNREEREGSKEENKKGRKRGS